MNFECMQRVYDLQHLSPVSIGNVAFQKTAWQTGTWNGLEASYAVDGKGYTANQEYCAHPDPLSPPGCWAVDLGAVHRIFNVTIYNTQNNGMMILIDFMLI